MTFDITVANPGDLLATDPTLTVLLQDANSQTVYARVSGTQSVLSVTKPDVTSATATYLVSFGLELTTANKALGAAIYADPYCMCTADNAKINDAPTNAL